MNQANLESTMPFKARQFYYRRNKMPKTQPKRDWSEYNKKMKMRSDMTIWLSSDVIEQWVIADRQYDGSGAPLLLSGLASKRRASKNNF